MTEAQRAANNRNFLIFRIRGLHVLAFMLSPARCQAVQAIIDDELRELGVMPQTERMALIRAEQERSDAAEEARAALEAELPF